MIEQRWIPVFVALLLAAPAAGRAQLPTRMTDLRISAIANSRIEVVPVPNSENVVHYKAKVRANVHNNSQTVPVRGPVRVTIRAKRDGQVIHEAVALTSGGIGPNATQPAWTETLVFLGTEPGQVTLEAVVDPLNQIPETNESNNTRAATITVKAVAAAPQGYGLTIRVFKDGTWRAGQGEWLQGAAVKVLRSDDNTLLGEGTTAANGRVTIQNIPGSVRVNIAVTHGGGFWQSEPAPKPYLMPGYAASVNIPMAQR